MVLVTIWAILRSIGASYPSISGYAFKQSAMALVWCKLTLRTDILHLHCPLQRLLDGDQAHLFAPILPSFGNTTDAQGCRLCTGLRCHVVHLAAAYRHLHLHSDREVLACRLGSRKMHAQLALLVYQCRWQHCYRRPDLHHPPTGAGKSQPSEEPKASAYRRLLSWFLCEHSPSW